ncbi:lipoate--protein ligase family protein [Evansella cellulosilytica]|uniref:Octanoyl-[GcvH]:protein N-octanoyltransferase n=1 Tax=Evansella cellulosilytica (strain ATCC 21833 / DSM 2522 / FERM P-1141 / JCM 9156 / N-4) TaxID=649639 RepID=E6TY40_EVAC2|nr:biotin/lipoate A/B protein ligase family protein [Evansella cellulosilytica]ADU32359.1 biotin/lipoate A/B protein ligase [Evansella cellulosilytica DSM 2522]
MKDFESPLFRKKWFILDQSVVGLGMNPIQSFAIDDTLCRRIGQEDDSGIARSWVHNNTVVLGIQDHRLPHIETGIDFLKEAGYDVIVRNSGGLAVVLDEQVLNISLLFQDNKEMSIDHGYELMVMLIRLLLGELGEEVIDGEVKESYCPGRYDLSIAGKKFAGISQRRIRGGVAVQIYIAVSGSGSSRAALIKQFYDQAVQGAPTKFEYPKIIPTKMTSLDELSTQPFSVQSLMHSLLITLSRLCDELRTYQLTDEDWNNYEDNLARMIKRNEKLH